MKEEIIIKPKILQFVADGIGLIVIWFICLLFTGYDNKIASIASLILTIIITTKILCVIWQIQTTTWTITGEQLIYKRGILNKKTDYIELYRIHDFQEEQSFIQRMCSTKTIIIDSSDKSHPNLVMKGVDNANRDIVEIRLRVEENKQKKKVYEMANR